MNPRVASVTKIWVMHCYFSQSQDGSGLGKLMGAESVTRRSQGIIRTGGKKVHEVMHSLHQVIPDCGTPCNQIRDQKHMLYLLPANESVSPASVVSDSLQIHGQQHTRLLCPSPVPSEYSHMYEPMSTRTHT